MKKERSWVALLLVMGFLVACSNPESSSGVDPADEFEKYKTEGIEPLYDRSLELAEMGGHFNSIISETENARTYMIDEMIPYAEQTKKLAEKLQDELVHEEIKDLNSVTIDQLDMIIRSFNKQVEFLELHIPPVSDESFAKSEEVYAEVMNLQEQIDEKTEVYNIKLEELEFKYGS
ncbi:hypothetical protein C772_03112 [Bhargavaea cecembensis DSE10]|uniref:Lipoprotein n=1 Tax=Bhargavaea cecembensis DSE10 TaxID=1235279 RepID=M7NCQ5_9BACL|nr:hypothetical protein [Bhargavaea cecembensis]EMR04961.1 hypothetical protein C772_03112 [Bhargavaea cecembensis DSE10]